LEAQMTQLVHETMDDDELEKIRHLIATHEIVDGPPILRRVVEQLWPELLHKIKPPRELMH
jgi:hypothetical protein